MRKRVVLTVAAMAVAYILGVGTAAFTAVKHPQIHAAMRALGNAARHLERATHHFGGHRAKALELTRAAEAELRLALSYADAPRR